MSVGYIGGASLDSGNNMYWSLADYENETDEKEKEKDGFEKSILEKFADDIQVTISAKDVKIRAKKII